MKRWWSESRWLVLAVVVAVLALTTMGRSAVFAANENNGQAGLKLLEEKVAALETAVAELRSQKEGLAQLVSQLQTDLAAQEAVLGNLGDAFEPLSQHVIALQSDLSQEVARAQTAEADIRAMFGETWHGYFLWLGQTVGWTAHVTYNGDSFTGWTTEVWNGSVLIADISGAWNGNQIQFTKVYRNTSDPPIYYTGSVGGGGDRKGTFSRYSATGEWGLSR